MIRRRVISGVILLVALGIGCRPYNVVMQYDEFDQTAMVRMSNNVIGGEGLFDAELEVDAGVLVAPGQAPSYALIVYYRAGDWLFIERGESLVFLIDGERLGLTTTANSTREVAGCSRYGCGIVERAIYTLVDGPEPIRRIANARVVKVQVRGSRGAVARDFTSENLRRFAEFAAKYAPPDSASN